MIYNILCDDGSAPEPISDLLLSYFPESSDYQNSKYFFSIEDKGNEFNFIFDPNLPEDAARIRPEILNFFSGRILHFDPAFTEERFLEPLDAGSPLFGLKTWICSPDPKNLSDLPVNALIARMPTWQQMNRVDFLKACQKEFSPIASALNFEFDGVILKMEETVDGFYLEALATRDIPSVRHLKIDDKPIRIQKVLKYSLPKIQKLSKINKGELFAIHCADELPYCKLLNITFSD